MKKICLLLLLSASLVYPQPRTIRAAIDASRTGEPISPYIYGMFIEHIGNIINNGLWAEMLDDRKFYYPITSQPPAAPAKGRRLPLRRWTPIGPDSAITMDTRNAYTGDHSPAVTLSGSEPRGFQQAGLAVRKGKAYTGRIVLAGDSTVTVQVALVWGEGPSGSQPLTFPRLTQSYRTYPLKFQAGADSDNARLAITGSGKGIFRVGAVSLMPADNIQGFRREVIEQLRQLRSGVYRFPGGNFVSAHDWHDAIGDPDKRPPVFDPVWNALQPNDVGTDEFIALCRLLDVEPYITVNAGFGDAYCAASLVEYANGAPTTPMGRLRAANGHPEPYRVKFWGIGNEMFGDWQFGFMAQEQYQIKHRMFAKAMRKVDPTITLLASGAMPDHMTGSTWLTRLTGRIVPEYLGPGDWSGGLLLNCLDTIDMLSEHFYANAKQRWDVEKGEQVPLPADLPLVEWARQPASFVRVKYEHYQEYLNRIPALREKRVPIALSEWAYTGVPANSFRAVLAYSWALHEMFRHSELFKLATFTFATSLLSSSRTEAVLNPTGLMFKLYRDHFGTIPVEVSGDSPQPKPTYPPGGQQPRVNPGSPTYPLDVAAALTADKKVLTVAVVNPNQSEFQLKLEIKGVQLAGSGTLYRMAPDRPDATITVGQKPGVEVERHKLDSVPGTVRIPPISVSIYQFPVR